MILLHALTTRHTILYYLLLTMGSVVQRIAAKSEESLHSRVFGQSGLLPNCVVLFLSPGCTRCCQVIAADMLLSVEDQAQCMMLVCPVVRPVLQPGCVSAVHDRSWHRVQAD